MQQIDKELNPKLYYATRSLCPVCNELVAGQVVPKGNQVFVERTCPQHGFFEGLICSDREWYERLPMFFTDGIKPLNPVEEKQKGCPEDCGLCVAHSQIAGTLAIEISDRCNGDCPTCLANNQNTFELTVADVEDAVKAALKNQSFISTVTLSGGEPTIHKDLFEMIQVLNRPEIGRIAINTNGIRIANDEEFVKRLAEQKNIYISLHFDGDQAIKLRGIEHSVQQKALQQLEKYGIGAVPVVLATKDYNDHELGTILEKLLINYKSVKSVMFSLMTYTGGQGSTFIGNPLTRLTIPEALECMERSTNGRIKKTDFIPLPMPNPMCASIGYFLKMDNELTPLIQFGEIEEIVKYIKNAHFGTLTPEFAAFIRDTINNIYANPDKYKNSEALLLKFKKLYQLLFPTNVNITHQEREKIAEECLQVVYLMQFMDSWSFDSKRLSRCSCQHALPNGRIVPTCSFYCYHRER